MLFGVSCRSVKGGRADCVRWSCHLSKVTKWLTRKKITFCVEVVTTQTFNFFSPNNSTLHFNIALTRSVPVGLQLPGHWMFVYGGSEPTHCSHLKFRICDVSSAELKPRPSLCTAPWWNPASALKPRPHTQPWTEAPPMYTTQDWSVAHTSLCSLQSRASGSPEARTAHVLSNGTREELYVSANLGTYFYSQSAKVVYSFQEYTCTSCSSVAVLYWYTGFANLGQQNCQIALGKYLLNK